MARAIPPPGARLQAGGSIRAESVYVERHADSELAAALREGEICHVLAPRQMGKTSLCGRVAQKLGKDGITCIQVDLNLLGGRNSVPDIDSWFFSLIRELSRQLGWPREFADDLWEREALTTATYKWSQFLHEEVPRRIAGPVVFIFDEIDTILTLPFSCDDFFAVVRALFNARPEHPELRRIAVCFVGVAAPGELILDATRTPLNVGVAVSLMDFTRSEVDGFLPAMAEVVQNPADWLEAIYSWTAGHPYMTHKLCAELSKRPSPADVPAIRIEELVRRHFLQTGRTTETNLQYAERRIDSRPSSSVLFRMYRRILEGQSVPADRNDQIQYELWLSGICRWHQGCLVVRNRIFAIVFDWSWVRGKESVRLLDEALERWLTGGKRPELVLSGGALDASRTWAEGRSDLTAEEQEFLLVSMEAARASSIRRALQVAVGSLSAALIICVSLFIWQLEVWQKKNAIEHDLRAMAQKDEQRQRSYAEELRTKNAELEQLHKDLERSLIRLKASDDRQQKENLELKSLITDYLDIAHRFKKQASRDEREVGQRMRAFEQEQDRWKWVTPDRPVALSPAVRDFQKALEGGTPVRR